MTLKRLVCWFRWIILARENHGHSTEICTRFTRDIYGFQWKTKGVRCRRCGAFRQRVAERQPIG